MSLIQPIMIVCGADIVHRGCEKRHISDGCHPNSALHIVCQCSTEKCNPATATMPHILTMVSLVVASVVPQCYS